MVLCDKYQEAEIITYLFSDEKDKEADRELKKSNDAYKDANTKLVLVNSSQQAYDIEHEMKLNEFALDIAMDSLISMMDELGLTTLE